MKGPRRGLAIAAVCLAVAMSAFGSRASDDEGDLQELPDDQIPETSRTPMYGQPEVVRPNPLRQADSTFANGTLPMFDHDRCAASNDAWIAAERYLADKKLNLAMSRFNHAWILDPENFQPYWGFGLVFLRKGEPDAAIPHLETARRLSGGRQVCVLANLGTAYSRSAERKKDKEARSRLFAFANEAFAACVQADPAYSDGWAQWSASLAREGDKAGAAAKLVAARGAEDAAAGAIGMLLRSGQATRGDTQASASPIAPAAETRGSRIAEADDEARLADSLMEQKSYTEAERHFAKALDLARSAFVGPHPRVAAYQRRLARAQSWTGNWKAAISNLRSALATLDAVSPTDSTELINTLGSLAFATMQLARPTWATPILRRFVLVTLVRDGPDDPTVVDRAGMLGIADIYTGEFAEAERLLRMVATWAEAKGVDGREMAAVSNDHLALLCVWTDRPQEAARYRERAENLKR